MVTDENFGVQVGHDPPSELSVQSVIDNLLNRWRLMLFLPITGIALAFAVSFLFAKKYDVTVLLSPRERDSSVSFGGMSSQIASLASIAGIGVGSGSGADVGVAVLKSDKFIRDFIEARTLLPVLFSDQWDPVAKNWIVNDTNDSPTLNDGTKYFQDGVLRVRDVARSNLINVTVSWSEPAVAAEWANDLVSRLNADLRGQAVSQSERRIFQLNKELENVQQVEIKETVSYLIAQEIKSISAARAELDYAFTVVDPPYPPDPDDYSFPNRVGFSAFGGLAGLLVAATLALSGGNLKVRRRKGLQS